ncbi:hypothetical protein CPAST_c31080 [Clostridium pasteurianum DSM 525 = ATCC 6013]|uniref:Uncharacterized protein n=1 Tax=Clostridium pasteurianum DSM 525 = ATCC 6013 TaxID=1262449 RepID=A0A0H3J6T4_CLOPA|nr:hypothetical protein [Clostridium pasteurianum]AJA49174.1 hypothetical protein CPAST_c31080 [Clostridium pasteurianum DSM 525 = ATCC 6013]AJA53162.1 hypothetical protein CLPA_c31080 [Clostridium pasteurianum DSM 525 = ATCC 6013]AOZ76357.1 hypothetical protein AQ983_15075 [Clostridium pasteurianum DSM 525 = ATCC 6013]AOZ80154.1 hypothetical protein AQ984_15070 [Clostridium pasteurianum]ELP59105.1 hypothetical protein F502_11486 [Clostridium pasteurianum DSM 525 = ATCC 6013]
MDEKIEILLKFDKEKLAWLVVELLDRLDETEQIQFISKNIDAKLAIDSANKNGKPEFLKEVKDFYKACIKGEYYAEPHYDDYWDSYDYDDFKESQWAQKFTEYFNTVLLYSRNKNYDVAFEAFELLFNCIKKASFDEEILGTESPECYIDVNWKDVFDEYYTSIVNCIKDKKERVAKCFKEWLNFGERCEEAMLSHVNDISILEEIMRRKIDICDEWSMEYSIFKLLQNFYDRYEKGYNKVEFAKSFLRYNVNFYYDIVKAYFELGKWEQSINLTKEALKEIKAESVRIQLQDILIISFEKLNDFQEAFYAAKNLFYEDSNYENYKRARYFAEKVNNLESLMKDSEKHLKTMKSYNYKWIFIKILSYEGKIDKLLKLVEKAKEYDQYYYFKYICRSLLYRVFYDKKFSFETLNDFVFKVDEYDAEGIEDMLLSSEDINRKDSYIDEAVKILKEMVSFHIDAAKRSRYAKAAYYCSIIKEIFNFLSKEDEFKDYYDRIIRENNRRPALKDEMRKKIEE